MKMDDLGPAAKASDSAHYDNRTIAAEAALQLS